MKQLLKSNEPKIIVLRNAQTGTFCIMDQQVGASTKGGAFAAPETK